MGSALPVPLADNSHDVRLVGTHLDREIIDTIGSTGVHPGLGRRLPDSVRTHKLEELDVREGAR
jgi:glycerol-3-phosphate dehydrogenase (NAD(P)+)